MIKAPESLHAIRPPSTATYRRHKSRRMPEHGKAAMTRIRAARRLMSAARPKGSKERSFAHNSTTGSPRRTRGMLAGRWIFTRR
ncbi:MAG: hypothetical protein M3430_16865 [Acidobacteriota bacterium]|nr:hypothetical protein [Acidobacteriota bacterium]